jgi:hypothetical protein
MSLLKIWNLEHKYETTKAQLPKKVDGAQSSIERRLVPQKDIRSRTQSLNKGPWKYSHNPKPIMSPHTCIIFLLKPAKKNRKEKKEVLCMWNRKFNKQHMKKKCPKQLGHLPRKENHWYAPCPKIKPHLKNMWQSFENPLAHPKCIRHLWPKCIPKESIYLEIALMDSKAYTLTPWP